MEKLFDTKEQAEEAAKERNEKGQYDRFCPLIKNRCRHDCECFVGAYVSQTSVGPFGDKKVKFLVSGFCCNNAMFSGYRVCQN